MCGKVKPITQEKYFWAYQQGPYGWIAWCPKDVPPGSKAYDVAQHYLRQVIA